jgi:diaminohydroxyphosphoribosylaminopyrimidine deaminase/5-amino-6-(5-phosphoribosylamino)uracil reductase
MQMALRLAAKGRRTVPPNPMVGAVVVADGRVAGQGYHRRPGSPHAEILALRAAGMRARGATLYVTLEPCCHLDKRTPPCVPALIDAGLKRVVVAMPDPNPRVRGRGMTALRRAGLQVTSGCLRAEAERLNEVYVHWIRTGRPFVTLKAAMTLDGKLATASGESQWITGAAARADGHRLRSEVDAILVGIGTVLRDDPRLTSRPTGRMGKRRDTRSPIRVIMDSRLRIPLAARVLRPSTPDGTTPPTIVATTRRASRRRIGQLKRRGATVLVLPAQHGRVSLRACLDRLGRLGISSLLIEGGSNINASALRQGVVNRIRCYVAPRLLGGQDAAGMIGGVAPRRLAHCVSLTAWSVRPLGADLVIDARVGHPPHSRS